MTNDLIPILHKVCGNVAFYYRELPVPGQIIEARMAVLVDGTQPFPQQEMVCGSCRTVISTVDLKV
jgi:hypothetical protein